MASTLKIDTVTTPDGTGNITFSRPIVADGSNLTNLPASGKILQAIGASETTQRSTTSSSWVTASNALTVAITPASTGSKFFITVSGSNSFGSSSGNGWYGTVYRDSTNLGHATYGFTSNAILNSTAANRTFAFNFLDSPSASSEITYQFYFKVDGGTGTLSQNNATSHITVMEVSA